VGGAKEKRARYEGMYVDYGPIVIICLRR